MNYKQKILDRIDILEKVLDRAINHPSKNEVDQTAKVLCCLSLVSDILDMVKHAPEIKDSVLEVAKRTRKLLYPNDY